VSDHLDTKIEGEAITIVIHRSFLVDVAGPAAFDGVAGFESARIVDPKQFVEDVGNELRREAEDGSTLVHLMLDSAIRNLGEHGANSIEWEDSPC
jgi:hypothetical protein